MVKTVTTQGEFLVDPIDLSMIRTTILCIYAIIKISHLGLSYTDQVKPELTFMLASRCLIGTMAYTAMILCLKHIPISMMSILLNTSPFWTALLGYLIANDPILKSQMICMVGCFIGIIVLTTAELDLNKKHNLFKKSDHTDGNVYIGIFFAMICSWGYSFVNVATRYLREIH
jgi:drug/metabolite transporter (DMT)-like permease